MKEGAARRRGFSTIERGRAAMFRMRRLMSDIRRQIAQTPWGEAMLHTIKPKVSGK
ncbi:hypothetical protein [Novosphingobium rosa]|uniref:hypothetical protein n=1 Tax=Novosphingobium rosa TaxID=76978 RepID=UPI000AF92346|nr:hypothetical protein [Novosphingobium rosa]